MNVTTHERPGVYSVYGASSLVRGSGGRKTVGLAAVNTKAEAGVIQTITSYEEAVSTFGSQADGQDMAGDPAQRGGGGSRRPRGKCRGL